MNKAMRAVCYVLLTTLTVFTVGTGSASAAPISKHVKRPHPVKMVPSECHYERFYPGRRTCKGVRWTISIEQECRMLWESYPEGLVKDDPVCAPYKP